MPRRYLPDSSGSARVTDRVWPRTYFRATCATRASVDPVAARTRACAYVAVLGLRDGHTAASVQTQLDGWATTATIAGYASTNVSHLLVRQLPRIRTVLRGFVRVEVQGRRGKGTGRRGERICRDRRHVEPLCRDSSCAMCVVCRKRDGARHTPRLRRRRDPFL